MKAAGSGRMQQHLQGHLDLRRQQLAAAVPVAAGPELLPGLLVAKQLRTLGSLLSHWAELSQSTAAVLSVVNAAAWKTRTGLTHANPDKIKTASSYPDTKTATVSYFTVMHNEILHSKLAVHIT